MKSRKKIYWIMTILFCLFMAFSAINGLVNPEMKQTYIHLGFPDYFRIELSIGKLIGIILLLIPTIPLRFKEWAYVAFGILLISASIAHASVGDSIGQVLGGLIFLAILFLSYINLHKIKHAYSATMA